MPIIIDWSTYAKTSYFEELDFIDFKWNQQEVEKFIDLVDEFVVRLSKGIIEGKTYTNHDISSIVLSEQTTVFFRKYPLKNSITLLLFWNNQRDPKALKRTLQKL